MKKAIITLLLFCVCVPVREASGNDYVFFIRQIQMPDNLEWDVSVAQTGQIQSPLEINPHGARFELWSIRNAPLRSYLLDSTYVNSYIPVSTVRIISEDPYETVPRTRADRPFSVEVTMVGLSSDPAAPPAARSVKLLRHAQAYPEQTIGTEIDRDLANLLSEGTLTDNGTHSLAYPVNAIPGADRTKVRGEERFSVFSLEDYQAPESLLDSVTLQVWPMTTHSLTGMVNGQVIKGALPELSIEYIDLYPDSWTYLQAYKGPPVLGTSGIIVPGSSVLVDASVPQNEILRVKDLDSVIREDGSWTLEVVTVTPFGTERLQHLTIEVDRTIRVNGTLNTVN
jgi:hypothetical protein